MAKPKTYPRLTREATDPNTTPARLEKLAGHASITVRRLALANPSLSTASLSEKIRLGQPAAWDNPAAVLALLSLTPADIQEGAVRCATELARLRMGTCNLGPEDSRYPVSDAMRDLLHAPLVDAWQGQDGGLMLLRAARYAQTCGCLSRQHHASTLLLCLAYRMRLKDHGGTLRASEEFAWSQCRDVETWRTFVNAPELQGSEVAHYAGIVNPRVVENLVAAWMVARSGDGLPPSVAERIARAIPTMGDLADVLRAAMPVPMWLDELTPLRTEASSLV